MANYINETSIQGMMNKLAFIDTDLKGLGFYKKKDKSHVVYFRNRLSQEDEQQYEKISYMYLDEKPDCKKVSATEQIISVIDEDLVIKMEGKKYREIRETRNKYDKIIEVRPITADNEGEIIEMIEKWRYLENGGVKYGFVEHASIDKSMVHKCYSTDLKDRLLAFSFYIDNKCIGYSTIENSPSDKIDGIYEYKYLTRKVLLDKSYRNLTEYIDLYTFRELMKIHKENFNETKFLINWGCSSGGVKWYKMNKWPLYKTEKKWFLTIKNEKKTNNIDLW